MSSLGQAVGRERLEEQFAPVRVVGITGTEGKLRQWLSTIPSSDPGRPWDDEQIRQIVEFAKSTGIEHLTAEGIYERWVEHCVELADME